MTSLEAIWFDIRNTLALWCIKAARKLTSWGEPEDHLYEAERSQRMHNQCKGDD